MKTVCEILGLLPTEGDFGIEIECEGESLKRVDNGTWVSTDDGSLRGVFPDSRCEWVLKKPLPLGKAIAAIRSLGRSQEKAGAKLAFSFRTSVHVHVNAQQMTEDQYCNFLYAYMLLEEPLIRFCGEGRKANRFCLSINDGEGLLDHLAVVFREGVKPIKRMHDAEVRYAALNIAATQKYGSVEFRAMRGTLDTDVLSTWLMALNNIRDYAMKMDTPQDIHDEFVKNSPTDFLRSVLDDVAGEFEYPGMEGDMRNNFSITLELVYGYKPFGEKKPAPVEKLIKEKLVPDKEARIVEVHVPRVRNREAGRVNVVMPVFDELHQDEFDAALERLRVLVAAVPPLVDFMYDPMNIPEGQIV